MLLHLNFDPRKSLGSRFTGDVARKPQARCLAAISRSRHHAQIISTTLDHWHPMTTNRATATLKRQSQSCAIVSAFDLQAGDINAENLWAEIKSAEAGWLSAVGFLAVYRLESSEKEIHFAVMSEANAKLAPTSDIAFHNQPAEALFVGAHGFSGR